MDFKICVLLLGTVHLMLAEQTTQEASEQSPYLQLILCPIEDQPWECARQNGLRLLNDWNINLKEHWEELKVEADQSQIQTLQQRQLNLNNETASSLLEKISFGAQYIQSYLIETANRLFKEYADLDVNEQNGGDNDQASETDALPNVLGPLLNEDGDLLDENNDNSTTSKSARSVGVARGKKKKKKLLMKVLLLGAIIKGKIELLLKILSAHLQVKFFAIALAGLLINAAKFWIDLKKGQQPQKVIYYEHAHHQHHYEDHGDDWGGESGGYWKRSMRSAETSKNDVSTSVRPSESSYFNLDNYAQRMAFKGQTSNL